MPGGKAELCCNVYKIAFNNVIVKQIKNNNININYTL